MHAPHTQHHAAAADAGFVAKVQQSRKLISVGWWKLFCTLQSPPATSTYLPSGYPRIRTKLWQTIPTCNLIRVWKFRTIMRNNEAAENDFNPFPGPSVSKTRGWPTGRYRCLYLRMYEPRQRCGILEWSRVGHIILPFCCPIPTGKCRIPLQFCVKYNL